MKSLARVLFAAVFLTQVSCSDFFNKGDRSSAGDQPRGKADFNPFPAGYDPTVGPFSESKMLAHIGLNLIAPLTRELRLHAENLKFELEAWRSAAVSGDETAASQARRSAEERWIRAMLVFHQLDAVPVGPASDAGGTLAQQIYSWPDFNACGIDLEMVKHAATGRIPESLIYTQKGLAAIEYLLFEKSLGTQCNPANPRNRPAVEWTRKDPQQKWLDRAGIAIALTTDLIAQTRRLETAWDPQGPNFAKVLVDGSRYGSVREATNALSDAMFSLESIKDRRLGRPLGFHTDCKSPSGKCPEVVEHLWSSLSIAAITSRLTGLLAVVRGGRGPNGAGFGIDDLLAEHGRAEVAEGLILAIETALQDARQTEMRGSLNEQVQNMDLAACRSGSVPVCTLFSNVRALSTFMKIDFLSALSLRAPPKFQGDND